MEGRRIAEAKMAASRWARWQDITRKHIRALNPVHVVVPVVVFANPSIFHFSATTNFTEIPATSISGTTF